MQEIKLKGEKQCNQRVDWIQGVVQEHMMRFFDRSDVFVRHFCAEYKVVRNRNQMVIFGIILGVLRVVLFSVIQVTHLRL